MTFSCIIPAYNEWLRISDVLMTVLACSDIDEVIVVDDGSTDNTREMIESFAHPRLRTIFLDNNRGKTHAVIAAIRIAKWEYIVMIDADLINLYPEHITALVEPVRTGQYEVTLSTRENSLFIYKFFGTDFVSWERVIPRSLFVDEQYYLSGPGFWLEVLMNAKIIENKYSIKNIYFPNLISPRKSLKYWYFHGTLADWKMNIDIIRVVPIHRLAYQLWYFSRFYPK